VRILFVIGELGLGGAERQLLVLARSLEQSGQEVTIAVFRGGGKMAADPVAAGIDIRVLQGRWAFGKLASLRRLVAAMKPDVVHGYLTVGNIAVLVARLVRLRPLIAWGVRASDMRMRAYPLKWRVAAYIERRLAPFADLLIANSQAGRATIIDQGVNPEKIIVIENGIDLSRFSADGVRRKEQREAARRNWGLSEEHVVVGHVARIDPMKDHGTFLSALASAVSRRPNLHGVAVAVGSAEARNTLKLKADASGLKKHLTIIEAAPDIAAIYPGFDLFCSSSAWGEGFSNVIAEALASGLPVVVTDVGDAAALAGDAGRCVAAKNAAALADAMVEVADQQAAFASRARERVTDFGPERLTSRTLSVLAAHLPITVRKG
jgi:glycosyltransferase involved in cell wall biosynthesis